jgi:hypothetical protein
MSHRFTAGIRARQMKKTMEARGAPTPSVLLAEVPLHLRHVVTKRKRKDKGKGKASQKSGQSSGPVAGEFAENRAIEVTENRPAITAELSPSADLENQERDFMVQSSPVRDMSPPVNDVVDQSPSRKRFRSTEEGSGSGDRRRCLIREGSWLKPDFVLPEDDQGYIDLSDEISNVPKFKRLGSSVNPFPRVGTGLLNRATNYELVPSLQACSGDELCNLFGYSLGDVSPFCFLFLEMFPLLILTLNFLFCRLLLNFEPR